MATEKVGVYRKYYGKVPTDAQGKPMPKSEWLKKRSFSWAVRWFGTEGNRYSQSFKSRKEAEQFAERIQSDVRKGKSDPPPQTTLKQFYNEHGELMKGNLAETTLKMHLKIIEQLAEHLDWNYLVKKVTVRDIESFRAKRLKLEISAATANRELRTLKRVFNLAITRGYLGKDMNPCANISLIKITPTKPRYCNPQEFAAIYETSLDAFWKALIAMAYTSGLRLQEMLNLTWADIDFQSNQLQVTRKIKRGLIQPWQPKDYEMRTIPVPEQTTNLLVAWQMIAPEKCPYVFMDAERWNYYRERVTAGLWHSGQDLVNNILRRFKNLCKAAKVPIYAIHDLRRSCITNWAKHLPIHVVQQLAGHSDIRTTQEYYLSVQADDLEKARLVQSKFLGKIPQRDLTDPQMTHSRKIRAFPGRQANHENSQHA